MNPSSDAVADLAALEAAAMAQYQAGNLPAAAQGFRDVLERDPDHAIALEFLAFEASARADYTAAIAYYQRAAQLLPTEALIQFNLAMAFYGRGDLAEALEALDQTLARDPKQIEAQLYRGTMLERLGRPADAANAYLKAVRFAEGQLDPQLMPTELKRFLNHALGVVRTYLDAEIDRNLADLVAEHGAPAVARLRQAGDIFVGKREREYAHPQWRPGLMYVPGLPPQAFYSREDFVWAAKLEAATEMIRAELLNVLQEQRGFAPYVNYAEGTHEAEVWKDINKSYDWSTFHLYRHGERIEENCARCPGTAALLESIDLMRVPGYGPEAMFSVLKPHSRIPPHYGTVNGRLIVHLPLIVPENCGALRAAGEARPWHEGELMIFDDSFEHEAWNDSDETRVVLIFDTWNPHLTPIEREAFSRVLVTAQKFEQAALS
jgi:aspartate beta-hydroxylase